jgi:hypothetical protein
MKKRVISQALALVSLTTVVFLFTQCKHQPTVKELIIKKVPFTVEMTKMDINRLMESVSWNKIDVINWAEFSYRPDVQFRMAYSDSAFIVQYKVKEKYIRAKASEDNGRVNLDACVEIFISPDGEKGYYSLESNCVGVCLFNYGNSRYNREFGPPELFGQIRRYPSLGYEPFAEERKGDFDWDLTLVLPYGCLFKHSGFVPEKGKQGRINFYKCGDELTEEHYLTWSPIQSEKPDYHRPECFGIVKFE